MQSRERSTQRWDGSGEGEGEDTLEACRACARTGVVWFGVVSTTLLLAAVFCFHCLLVCSFCWFVGVAGPVLSSPCNTPTKAATSCPMTWNRSALGVGLYTRFLIQQDTSQTVFFNA